MTGVTRNFGIILNSSHRGNVLSGDFAQPPVVDTKTRSPILPGGPHNRYRTWAETRTNSVFRYSVLSTSFSIICLTEREIYHGHCRRRSAYSVSMGHRTAPRTASGEPRVSNTEEYVFSNDESSHQLGSQVVVQIFRLVRMGLEPLNDMG